MENILISIFFLLVTYLIIRVVKLEGRMKGLQYTVDQLTKKLGITENPINDELRSLISEGKEVKAIKKAREILGLSLVEGKEYIDRLKID